MHKTLLKRLKIASFKLRPGRRNFIRRGEKIIHEGGGGKKKLSKCTIYIPLLFSCLSLSSVDTVSTDVARLKSLTWRH